MTNTQTPWNKGLTGLAAGWTPARRKKMSIKQKRWLRRNPDSPVGQKGPRKGLWLTGPDPLEGVCECIVGSGTACELSCDSNNNGTYGINHKSNFLIKKIKQNREFTQFDLLISLPNKKKIKLKNLKIQLLGIHNSITDPTGFTYQATWNNPSGCLTVVFITDSVGEGTGWMANVSCGNQFQPF